MTKLLGSIILVVGILFTASASAREPVPLVDHENVQFTTSRTGALSIDEVKKIITTGAGAGKRVWTVSSLEGNRLLATTCN